MACEGCGYCTHVCPTGALTLQPRNVGWVMESATRTGLPLVHAKLAIGAQNSGKLVSEVKKRAVRWAEKLNRKYLIVDGSPGTGCPVVSSLSGADYVLLVIEPSMSSLHDALRLTEVVRRFRCPLGVLINKANIHASICQKAKDAFIAQIIPILGEIPYDSEIPIAISAGRTILEHNGPTYSPFFETIWERIISA